MRRVAASGAGAPCASWDKTKMGATMIQAVHADEPRSHQNSPLPWHGQANRTPIPCYYCTDARIAAVIPPLLHDTRHPQAIAAPKDWPCIRYACLPCGSQLHRDPIIARLYLAASAPASAWREHDACDPVHLHPFCCSSFRQRRDFQQPAV